MTRRDTMAMVAILVGCVAAICWAVWWMPPEW